MTTEGREERIDERCALLFVRERLVGLLQKGFPTLDYLDFFGRASYNPNNQGHFGVGQYRSALALLADQKGYCT